MDLELSVTDARAKRRVLRTLRELGHSATSGAVRLAYPFTVLVRGVHDDEVATLHRLVMAVDPGAGALRQPAVATPAAGVPVDEPAA